MKLTSAVPKKSQVSKSVQLITVAVRNLYTGSDLLYGICTLAKNAFPVKTISYGKAKTTSSVQFLYSLIVSHTYGFYLPRNTPLKRENIRGKHCAAETCDIGYSLNFLEHASFTHSEKPSPVCFLSDSILPNSSSSNRICFLVEPERSKLFLLFSCTGTYHLLCFIGTYQYTTQPPIQQTEIAMCWMKDNLQSICDNAVSIRPRNVRHEIKPLSSYYGDNIHDCIQMLTTVIHTDMCGDQLADVFGKGEAAREASIAIQILNDFQYLVHAIDYNLAAAKEIKLESSNVE